MATRSTKTKKKSTPATSTAEPAPTTSEWIEVAASKVHGDGVYAAKDIPAGTRVIEYVGEKITKAESQRRDEVRVARQEKGEDDGCVYLFEVNKRYDLDGAVSWNTARLINHSCEPNCETENVRGHIWISALRDIKAGEELSYDYGFDWENWKDHPCHCGSPKCFGWIVHRDQRKKVKKLLKKEAKKAKEKKKKGGKKGKKSKKEKKGK